MDQKLIALKAMLDELGIPDTITTIDDRKRVQKGVYLGQLSGVDLGYRFGWYVMGPYCSSLTRDYYGLAEAIASGDRSFTGKSFSDGVRNRLAKIKPLMNLPQGFPLSKEAWLELVSSLHYLRSVRRLDRDEALKVLESSKAHLYPYVESAETALKSAGLLA